MVWVMYQFQLWPDKESYCVEMSSLAKLQWTGPRKSRFHSDPSEEVASRRKSIAYIAQKNPDLIIIFIRFGKTSIVQK